MGVGAYGTVSMISQRALSCIVFLFVATCLYLHGFLRTRVTSHETYSRSFSESLAHAKVKYSVHIGPPRRYRIFVFMIDALRLDFLLFHDNPSHSTYNQFRNIHKLLQENSSQSMLFAVKADLPTTTSQCIKTLVSGNVQALVDMGSNFHSAEMLEDNFVSQLAQKPNTT